MDISKALKLKCGDVVHCSSDRGDHPFTGKVCTQTELIEASEIHETLKGTKYIWIEIDGIGKKSVWPSNRLW